MLRKGPAAWNSWRSTRPAVKPDLSGIDFSTIKDLDPPFTDLSYFDLSGADLRMSTLRHASFLETNLEGAYAVAADFCYATFIRCNLNGVRLRLARLGSASFTDCDLTNADLAYTSADETSFIYSNLQGANLQNAHLVKTDFQGSDLSLSQVYGVAAWDLGLTKAKQEDLIITLDGQPLITVDSLEVAQFIHLLLNNRRLRTVIETITSKVVLILGRFTPERKKVLNLLRNALRRQNYLPVMFDFQKPVSRTFIETVATLAHLSRFIIADFTAQGDVRREVQHIANALQSTPIVPILQEDEKAVPITLQDLRGRPSVLQIVRYRHGRDLVKRLDKDVIEPAERVRSKLLSP